MDSKTLKEVEAIIVRGVKDEVASQIANHCVDNHPAIKPRFWHIEHDMVHKAHDNDINALKDQIQDHEAKHHKDAPYMPAHAQTHEGINGQLHVIREDIEALNKRTDIHVRKPQHYAKDGPVETVAVTGTPPEAYDINGMHKDWIMVANGWEIMPGMSIPIRRKT